MFVEWQEKMARVEQYTLSARLTSRPSGRRVGSPLMQDLSLAVVRRRRLAPASCRPVTEEGDRG